MSTHPRAPSPRSQPQLTEPSPLFVAARRRPPPSPCASTRLTSAAARSRSRTRKSIMQLYVAMRARHRHPRSLSSHLRRPQRPSRHHRSRRYRCTRTPRFSRLRAIACAHRLSRRKTATPGASSVSLASAHSSTRSASGQSTRSTGSGSARLLGKGRPPRRANTAVPAAPWNRRGRRRSVPPTSPLAVGDAESARVA